MKIFILTLFSCFLFNLCRAQNQAPDRYPAAQIYVIDYQSGREVLAGDDAAIAFKDAFIDLVSNSQRARMIMKLSPGHKTQVIKQIDPQKLNGYQLTMQTKFLGQTSVIGTYYYNIDENALYFFDQNQQNWIPEPVTGLNVNNLSNVQAYAQFNSQAPAQTQAAVPDLSLGADSTVTVNTAPPALPEYEQPPCPEDGYLWQPGYWNYSRSNNDYYWVPGVWIAPPNPGLYWTPNYWGYDNGFYRFHVGYWGPTVGFYGGINYGYGYGGHGFAGGEWRNGGFRYNTAVVRVNTTVVHNTYVNTTVVNNTTVSNRVSFNGPGGVVARPTQQERVAMNQPHIQPTQAQLMHQQVAVSNKGQFASVNQGRPAAVTMDKVDGKAFNTGGTVTPINRTPRAPGGPPALGRPANTGIQAGNTNTQQRGGQPQQTQPGQVQRAAQQPAGQTAQPNQQRGVQQPAVQQQAGQQRQVQQQQGQFNNQQQRTGQQPGTQQAQPQRQPPVPPGQPNQQQQRTNQQNMQQRQRQQQVKPQRQPPPPREEKPKG